MIQTKATLGGLGEDSMIAKAMIAKVRTLKVRTDEFRMTSHHSRKRQSSVNRDEVLTA